mmetsp:Transcript_7644/g.20276  ORF Transcript_7644/g.20276 Transcript_7644/m.20276 type:complete len:212 (+) Transcript_7644:217-852(+)
MRATRSDFKYLLTENMHSPLSFEPVNTDFPCLKATKARTSPVCSTRARCITHIPAERWMTPTPPFAAPTMTVAACGSVRSLGALTCTSPKMSPNAFSTCSSASFVAVRTSHTETTPLESPDNSCTSSSPSTLSASLRAGTSARDQMTVSACLPLATRVATHRNEARLMRLIVPEQSPANTASALWSASALPRMHATLTIREAPASLLLTIH